MSLVFSGVLVGGPTVSLVSGNDGSIVAGSSDRSLRRWENIGYRNKMKLFLEDFFLLHQFEVDDIILPLDIIR
jgi:hypothetical protein